MPIVTCGIHVQPGEQIAIWKHPDGVTLSVNFGNFATVFFREADLIKFAERLQIYLKEQKILREEKEWVI